MVIIDIRTLELNRFGYLGSGFVHLLPDVSGLGRVVVPPINAQFSVIQIYWPSLRCTRLHSHKRDSHGIDKRDYETGLCM